MDFDANSENGRCFINLQQVSFTRFNGPALQNITWQIREGEIWAITGPTGAGKTTLAEALAGQHRQQSGIAQYFFLPQPEKSWELKKYVAFISFQPQERDLNYAHFYCQQRYNSSDADNVKTVQDYLQETTAFTPSEPIWDEVIKLMQLEELLPLAIIKLSNGQTHKMLIARALLRQPRLLILDNPFTGLDKETRFNFNQILQNLSAQGTQIILITSPTSIPDFITQVLELADFKITGIFSRTAFVEKQLLTAETENTFIPKLQKVFFPEDNTVASYKLAVQFTDTTISYDGKKILNSINWTVRQGEKWALSGPNGSGKTTLLSLINGDNPQAFANKIILFDRRKGTGESIWDIKKRIGFVSPELHLYFRQNLPAATIAATGFFDTTYPKHRLTDAEEEKINHLFNYFQISHLQNKSFLQLSASEQRIVLIIRSLVKNPEMLIWDEPYQGLSQSVIQKAQELLTIYATPAKTIIFVSHYEHEIPAWISNQISLENGCIKELTHKEVV